MQESHKLVYEGSAAAFIDANDIRDELRLEYAMRDAYEKAAQGRIGPFSFRVVGIFIDGTNPASDYRVQVVDHH